jgi:cell division protein FtsW (lipid II flippase)
MLHKKFTSIFYFFAPIIATIVGISTVKNYEIPISVFYPNIAAIIIGICLSLVIIYKWQSVKLPQIKALAILSLLFLVSSFIFPGQLNVHRWISIAELNINISFVVLPIILFCIHCFLQSKNFVFAIILFIVTGLTLTIQPDAGQATSFALATLILFAIDKTNLTLFFGAFITVAIIIANSWLRVDLLEPVEYVEEILYMIRSLGPIGYFAILLTAVFSFYPFISMITKPGRALTIAFIVYLLSTFVVTEFGHYPVPLLGAGASQIIGWYLMLAFVFKQSASF